MTDTIDAIAREKHVAVLKMLWECAADYEFGPRTVEALKSAINALSNQGEGVVGVVVEGFGDAIGGSVNVAKWAGKQPEIGTKLYAKPTPAAEADRRDAERFRDLCELVQWGEWGLCEIEITDSHGNSKNNWQDGNEDIPAFCDKWANAARICREVRQKSEAKKAATQEQT